jgi:hypothetical protein
MKILYRAFGKERLVEIELHNMTEREPHDLTLWVEREEDYYALMSPEYKNKKVAIITRQNWLRAGLDP